ncbi:hypothetical protein NXS08_03110 [Gleimia sp. 6138-11-ORH1]|uniref:hypothetical protein n=1 Tax=Gleimia sp. 6138-11-ORH1 TaxID=2973937 RepID=UPI002167D65B|nr:hypothetical protein [Gleimia sp. 6138-11-ORH1]MCS4484478.1 hypothetical protein [Gleimia sp. 6138-11-ORH1]
MKILAIRYSADTAQMRHFYTTLGLSLNEETASDGWSEMHGSGGYVAVHSRYAETLPTHDVELSLEAEEPLEAIQTRLSDAGFDAGEIVLEDFGRSLRLKDPEGMPLQINGQ